ncbi:MAG: tetratricopeptide repeat protein, partial [Betaproteobacteria bacterium]
RARKGYVAAPRPAATTESARLKPGAPSDTPRAPSDAPTPSSTAPAPAEAPSRPAPAAAPAAPATGTVVPKAADTGSAALHLRPDAARNVEELAANAPDADAKRGWTAYQRGDLESARASLAAAAARPTARPWVHYALGQADYALGRYQDAVAEWETVRAGAPEFQPVYFDLVDGYIQLHDPDRAIGAMHAAQSRWPADAEVYEALGVVQTTRGALNDAIASFQKAVSLAPKDAVGYFNLAKALELRYVRTRRFVERTHTWMGNKSDLENAILNYKRYLEIGGPLENSAREGLARLNWEPEK